MTIGSSGGREMPLMVRKLLAAATSGDSTSILELVSQDRNILLGTTLQGNNCLHIACIYGHQGFCNDVMGREEHLLMAVNSDKETPLIVAVRNGHTSLAYFLLQSCCQPAFRQAILQQDRYGFNALHHAIRNGHRDLALQLIAAEAGLSQAVSKCNDSPMFFAVMRGFTDICDQLIKTNSCAYSGGRHGWNCLHAAVMNRDQEIAKIIMERRPELAREADDASCTPARRAVHFGNIGMLRVMLEHDSTLGYEIDSEGYPLLASAAYRGQVGAARELLKHCPDAPLYVESTGDTLLHVAVKYYQEEFIEFALRTPLLRKLVNMQDNEGKTALHYAVKMCSPTIVKALLSHEDIDATILDNAGISASSELMVMDVTTISKTLNWNEVAMLMSRARSQDSFMLYNLHAEAKQEMTEASRKAAKSLTQTYTSNTSLVAILIATITFAAGFTLPGGYSSEAGTAGLPIMSKKIAFQAFLVCDTLAMCSSFVVAFICLMGKWEDHKFTTYYISVTKKLTWFAYMATITAFSTGLYTVLASHLHWLAIGICSLVAFLPILTMFIGKWPALRLVIRLSGPWRNLMLKLQKLSPTWRALMLKCGFCQGYQPNSRGMV